MSDSLHDWGNWQDLSMSGVEGRSCQLCHVIQIRDIRQIPMPPCGEPYEVTFTDAQIMTVAKNIGGTTFPEGHKRDALMRKIIREFGPK